jgi:predicted alpha-1,2-mannosidase
MRRHNGRALAVGLAVSAAACSSGGGEPATVKDAGHDVMTARADASIVDGGRSDARREAQVDAASDAATDALVDDGSVAATRAASTPVSPLFIGSGGFGYAVGSAFPGAAAPQGMAKVGPETSGPYGVADFLHCSGYWYGDDTILGFSHLHLHGTGAQDYGVLGVMPTDAWDDSRTSEQGYASPFDKSTESATPGKYSVTLTRGDISVEITATPHAAHHRYTYPSTATAGHVILDLDHHLSGTVSTESVTLSPATSTITGSFRSIGQMSNGFGGYMVYFAARTNRPWSNALVWSQGNTPTQGLTSQGTGVGVDLDFDVPGATDGGANAGDASTDAGTLPPIELQVGLSLVSVAGAQANLDAEMPTFAFDDEAAATAAAWTAAVGGVTFTGGTASDKSQLTAALYHLFLMPSVLSDVDGHYVGLDGNVSVATGFHYVSDLSLWDTYRTLNPLYALVAPARALDTAMSLTAMGKAAGYFPKWPLATGEAGTMLGASAEVVLADAYLRGVTGFDAEGAYEIMRAAAMSTTTPGAGRGGRNNVLPYMQLGYVPSSVSSSVSWTVEYSQDDAALAGLAAALGHTSDATTLLARRTGYQKLFDPVTGFLWPKDDTGAWTGDHSSPSAYAAGGPFDEANAWQTVFAPWHDMPGLTGLFGGDAGFVAKLETFFEQGKADYDAIDWTSPLSVGLQRKFYWGGNEPSIHTPYLFALAGRPDLTQRWVRWIENEVYGAGADGLPGNDDGGTMSAWLIYSALGFYPVPGTDAYVVGAPRLSHASIAVGSGSFAIEAPGVSDTNLYVQSVTLNGAPLATPTIHQSDLKAGGSLVFAMGPSPSTWGR